MDARPILVRVARALREQGLEAVTVGNAAAAIQGAPVTTLDIDFYMRRTPANIVKLKGLASSLGAVVFKPFYPLSGMFRLSRDSDALQLDFMTRMNGVRSYNSLRSRATVVDIQGEKLLVAALADIIARQRAAGRPNDLSKPRSKRRITREQISEALKKESDLNLREMIRRSLALPPDQRTHFLRVKIGITGSCL